MAELLIFVVVAAALVLYAVDRARKLRARARQMSGMNDRLDAAAAKIDEEQRRKRARVRASAELTSVMPAIKRPPLTIPGMAGHGPGADEDAAPAAGNGPAAQDGPAAEPARTAGQDRPAGQDRTAEEIVLAEETPAAAQAPADPQAPADTETAAAEASPAPAVPLAESTLSMPAAAMADEIPAPNAQAAPEGTMIMAPVPAQGPGRAGKARPAAAQVQDERAADQERTIRR